MNRQLTPHFVADRPMSLRIIAGLDIERYPVKIGLMLQACTSNNFRVMAAKFPCGDLLYCGVTNGPCPYEGKIKNCKKGLLIKKAITTISDSGVFTKNGSPLNYYELFERYQQMKVKKGIILDVLRNKEETINSARLGMKVYQDKNYNFELIGVAQGKTPEEYVECYADLVDLGYQSIAIGGLLTKNENSARYAFSNKIFIESVVRKIKNEWPDRKCFTLGVYNPKRHAFLENIGVNGADYKGWIFQYEKRYSDPIEHHRDRIVQTRSFIENNILNKLINVEQVSHHSQNICNDNLLIVRGKRVYSNNPVNINSTKMVIISCGKIKNKVKKCKAKDAYIGNSFKQKKKYAKLSKVQWFILSAKYGLIKPDFYIDPNYDKTIKTKKDIMELSNLLKKQILHYPEFCDINEITFLGPGAYAEALNIGFNGKKMINHLTQGLGQGKSNKLIKEEIDLLENNLIKIAIV